MLKSHVPVEDLEFRSSTMLRAILDEVPAIDDVELEFEPQGQDRGVDFIYRFQVAGQPHALVCEVKANGQPRNVRDAVHHLKYLSLNFPTRATPVFVAPYLSEEARALCLEAGVGYADLEGNTHLVFDSVFIDRKVDSKPPTERRELRSLFKPKSAQVLRRLLRDPDKSWKVVDLADVAGVSVGHVSNVRKALIDRDWAAADAEGLRLTSPDALLDQWRDNYEAPTGERIFAYTPHHGRSFTDAVQKAAGHPNARVMLASFSAAQYLAPYGRSGSDHLYVDRAGYAALRQELDIGPVARGSNLEILVMQDDGLFRDAVEPSLGVWVTSPVQTYLDLSAAGERGREAADHLRDQGLRWPR
jgi:hypothetical protein